jgi:ABC-type lipoprotein export system ATPase subunit
LAKGLFKKKDDINSTKDIDELLSDVVGSEENVSEDELVEETSTETSVEAPVEASESPTNSEYIIDCDSLVKIYKTDEVEVMALQGLELTIKHGELMAVIGKSGSGKSTLLNMIGGLERPTAGKLYVDGKDLFALSDKELVEYRRHTVGFVWQKNSRNLLPYMTALENVQVPMYFDKDNKEDKEKRAKELLCMVGLENKLNSYPSQMSGGEQQRVAIAIALANNPKILLADEPTGAVDSKTSNMIQDLFRKLNEELGITIIIVTHDISLANKVGRVVMIADGKISTEKIMKEDYRKRINDMESDSFNGDDSHEEYSVLDKAHRVQISDDMLEAAGIDTNKVKIQVVDGKVIISKE